MSTGSARAKYMKSLRDNPSRLDREIARQLREAALKSFWQSYHDHGNGD